MSTTKMGPLQKTCRGYKDEETEGTHRSLVTKQGPVLSMIYDEILNYICQIPVEAWVLIGIVGCEMSLKKTKMQLESSLFIMEKCPSPLESIFKWKNKK